MKKYFYYLLLISFTACNNQSSGPKESKAADKTNAAKSETSAAASGSCGSLAIFHKGAVIEGKSYDGTGKETSSQTTTITDVKDEGGITIADAEMGMHSSSTKGTTMKVSFKCDGKFLYMDLGSVMANFNSIGETKIEATPLKFPLVISEGEALPNASISVQMDRGTMKMKSTSTYKDNKVAGKESVTTAAGTWNCFKVSSTIETNIDMGGGAKEQAIAEMMQKKSPFKKMTMWYAPDFGIIKTEMYSDGKLTLRSEVTSIKL